ncbi:GNAT family N-acetyltransferase [Cellulomonas cellasea]|uniref:Ribosomal protein S18 acetylase RimI-like enzyme n=1 Tax=Cellulomonas cellasea TaxID=43670 RepID=A0A7W4UF93_9CELL|nr:N-acetyltransferase [Cellulomonas cellasea]MBB2923128.1 ribosomal protein S18 acetylase RimI-like enzyme [Cellulomonas cellasea]
MLLRPALETDVDLLTDLVVEAVNWTGEQRVTVADVGTDDHLARYVEGWGRPGDVGVVAVGDAGEPLGAAWVRLLTADRAGWGFVAEDVPELSLGVLAPGRGAGAGSALLDACLDAVRAQGSRAVSLSVEDGNDLARGMYERRGFRVVGREGGSDVLLLDLSTSTTPAGRQKV